MSVTIHHEQKEAYKFLKDHKVGVLATVDPNGEPHAAAIYYDIDKSLAVTFVTKTQTKKTDNLRHYNHAMLVVYDAASQTTVQISGIVEEVPDTMEANRIFTQIIYASLAESDTAVPPIAKLHDEGEYVAFRLTPKQVRMAAFEHAHSGDYNELFTIIEPKND